MPQLLILWYLSGYMTGIPGFSYFSYLSRSLAVFLWWLHGYSFCAHVITVMYMYSMHKGINFSNIMFSFVCATLPSITLVWHGSWLSWYKTNEENCIGSTLILVWLGSLHTGDPLFQTLIHQWRIHTKGKGERNYSQTIKAICISFCTVPFNEINTHWNARTRFTSLELLAQYDMFLSPLSLLNPHPCM